MTTCHYSTLGTRSLKTLDGEDITMKGGVPLVHENPYSHHSYCVPGPVVSTPYESLPFRLHQKEPLCKRSTWAILQFSGIEIDSESLTCSKDALLRNLGITGINSQTQHNEKAAQNHLGW